MTLDFGMILCDQHPAGDDMHQRFLEHVEQVRKARDLGFRTLVDGQHYLTDPLQFLQPIPMLARMAAESGDMRLCSGVLLMGLGNPVDIAEQVATLDVISGGRTVIGAALGYRDVEFDAFGVVKGQRAKRFESNLDVVIRLLEGEEVTLDEPYCKLDGVRMALRPTQSPRPPLWMGANADKALERVARVGDTWLINPHARLDTLVRQMNEVYLPTLRKHGKERPKELPMRREVFVGESREDAIRLAAPWLMPKYAMYTAWGQDKALPEGDDFHEELNELIKDRFILGSPEECIAEIDRYREDLGVTEIIVRIQWPGMPNSLAMENLQRLGETLIPHYRRPGS